jgi:phosphoglycerol transferase MdoB-like AlkP superfamily enzyme
MASVLKDRGYSCIAMHPYLANGWKRNSVWPNLCFDRCMFMDDFPQKNLIRGLVSDREMFEVLLDTYKTEAEASGGAGIYIRRYDAESQSLRLYRG